MSTKVGQIFLTHPRDQNYTSLYEEAFSKFGQTIQLFAVVEIGDKNKEYEKLMQVFVGAFKKSYITNQQPKSESFEKALAAINATLLRLASKGKVNWAKKFNAAVAALHQNVLSLSVTGNAQVWLSRRGELTLLSEALTAEETRPIKVFTNYAQGKVASEDQIILSTNQLFNYLSLERIREFLAEDSLEETCQEVIRALEAAGNIGFAAFIVEVLPGGAKPAPGEAKFIPKPKQTAPASGFKTLGLFAKVAGQVALAIFQIIWGVLSGLPRFFLLIFRIQKRRGQKKYLVAAAGIAVLLLAGNLVASFVKKSIQEKQEQKTAAITLATQKLDAAEAALIYDDSQRVAALLKEAEALLGEAESQELGQRLASLKDKITKKVEVSSPVLLAQFGNIPTELIYSPNGFLAYNRDSHSLAFYDFRSGETKPLLAAQNTSELILGSYVGGNHGYVFLTRQGKFKKLDLPENSLVDFAASSPPALDLTASELAALRTFGSGENARLYFLDVGNHQIFRSQVQETEITPAAAWLKEEAGLARALDLAIDGSIYVLFPDRLEKYFNGSKQDFKLAAVLPGLSDGRRVFTSAEQDFIYLAEPKAERILIFDKQGKLARQLSSLKFRDLSDLYVDEKNRIMYVLSGSELLQVTIP